MITASTEMSADDLGAVKSSFGRCCLSDGFIDDFYELFFHNAPWVRERFAMTDMAQQKKLLRQGLTWLMMYAQGGDFAKSQVARLARSHSRSGHAIPPSYYEAWQETLLLAVEKHDPLFDESVDEKWRRVLRPGLELMRSSY
jgi:hemoglobin-like flavoprotein